MIGKDERTVGETSPLVVSVVLAFGPENELIDCVRSLLGQTNINHRIVVVQNGANSDLLNDLESRFTNILAIRNGSNVGAAAGRNIGIRWAIEHGAQYLFLADNDATFASDALSNLLSAATASPQIGFLSCIVRRKSNPEQIFSAGAYIEPPLSTRHLYDVPHDRSLRIVDFAPSCALLVPVSTIKAIGLMDESLFVYDEDVDWCLKGKKRGLKTAVMSTAKAYHDFNAEKGKSPLRVYYGIRNRLVVFQRHRITNHKKGYNWLLARLLVHNLWKHHLWGKGELSITCSFAYLLGIVHSQLGYRGAAPAYFQRSNANYLESRFRRWLVGTSFWSIARAIKRTLLKR